MRKHVFGLLASLTGAAFIVIVIGSYVIVAQTPITGEWRSEASENDGKLQLNFERDSNKGHNQFGSSFDYSDLQGLTRDQTKNGKVSFRLVREAGTVECEGTFTNGKGAGTFRFTPNQSFIDGMKARGFNFGPAEPPTDNVTGVQIRKKRSGESAEDKLLSAALINVTTALADDLKSVGFGQLDVDDLFKAAIFKIDSKFMAEMKATGFPDLTMEDLVKARIFNIDADYVRQVKDMGFAEKADFEGLVKFRIFKITPEFLAALKAEGFTNLSSEEVVKFSIFKIDPEFIRKAKAENPDVTVEDMVRMKIGVYRKKDTN